ncbi:unnamed protein product [Nezara viridula]|uniref:Uncharacterized protein n=1 Tax=Nezara viridula TaxID=85310 RepID=A0A9P0HE09_NEZVI|nr:unnamed protein product [Nezara viridula]
MVTNLSDYDHLSVKTWVAVSLDDYVKILSDFPGNSSKKLYLIKNQTLPSSSSNKTWHKTSSILFPVEAAQGAKMDPDSDPNNPICDATTDPWAKLSIALGKPPDILAHSMTPRRRNL